MKPKDKFINNPGCSTSFVIAPMGFSAIFDNCKEQN